jgi:hypothetical protein
MTEREWMAVVQIAIVCAGAVWTVWCNLREKRW